MCLKKDKAARVEGQMESKRCSKFLLYCPLATSHHTCPSCFSGCSMQETTMHHCPSWNLQNGMTIFNPGEYANDSTAVCSLSLILSMFFLLFHTEKGVRRRTWCCSCHLGTKEENAWDREIHSFLVKDHGQKGGNISGVLPWKGKCPNAQTIEHTHIAHTRSTNPFISSCGVFDCLCLYERSFDERQS
jgi:hypothetical protein